MLDAYVSVKLIRLKTSALLVLGATGEDCVVRIATLLETSRRGCAVLAHPMVIAMASTAILVRRIRSGLCLHLKLAWKENTTPTPSLMLELVGLLSMLINIFGQAQQAEHDHLLGRKVNGLSYFLELIRLF